MAYYNLISAVLLLLISACDKNSNKREMNFIEHYSNNETSKFFFPCDSLKYNISPKYTLDVNQNPILTEEDSINLIQYAIKHNQIQYAVQGKDTVIAKLLYLIPRIRNIVNIALYDSVIDENYVTSGIAIAQAWDAVNADAVITGKVFRKIMVKDSTKCFYYNTDYVIKITEVLHSYFPLNVGDLIVLKSRDGYIGGCNPSIANYISVTSEIHEYAINETGIFFLNHNDYYIRFLYIIPSEKYSDKYCPNAFDFYLGNGLYDFKTTTLLNSLRSFCKKI